MTLTLTRTLEIDIKLIPVEEDKALQLARQLWAFDQRPIEPQTQRKTRSSDAGTSHIVDDISAQTPRIQARHSRI
jgi:hypothetical protein